MNEIIHSEHDIRVFFQEISLVIHKVNESQEVEGAALAVGRGPAAHVVHVTVQLRYEKVHVLTAVVLWKQTFIDKLEGKILS